MERNVNYVKRFGLIMIFVLIFGICGGFEHFFGVVRKVLSAFSPFFTGACIAFAVNIFIAPTECILKKCKFLSVGVCRFLSIVIGFAVILTVLFAVLLIVIPKLTETFCGFSDKFSVYYEKLSGIFDSINMSANKLIPGKQQLNFSIDGFFEELGNYFCGSRVIGEKILGMTTSIAAVMANTVIAFVFSVYLLVQKEKITVQTDKLLRIILPKKSYLFLNNVIYISAKIFKKFLTGQLTEGCIIGVLCFLGMKILGFPYAAVSSIVIGFTALVPIFGALAGTAVGTLLIFTVSPEKSVWFIIFILCLQQIEGNIIYPKVVGKSVGLPGIWVLVSITVGGKLFGLSGMFFAVPVFSVIYTLLKDFAAEKQDEN